jgi:uncharacterized protein YabN with tetrapyrrole methylase and pyrophosphatase domain
VVGIEKRGSLTVVGTGLSLANHLTAETLYWLESADCVFSNMTNRTEEEWIASVNPKVQSLKDCYGVGKPREQTYAEMVTRVTGAVRSGAVVCVAFYGHPGVLAQATHTAVRILRREGFDARMLPAVSAEDCLFADLGIDPGDCGCQTFDASDFLLRRRRIDPTSSLILWQVGLLGQPSTDDSHRPERLHLLLRYLREYYPENHPLVLYQAASFPGVQATIERLVLADLPMKSVPLAVTMYIPPLAQRAPDPTIAAWLDSRESAMARTEHEG